MDDQPKKLGALTGLAALVGSGGAVVSCVASVVALLTGEPAAARVGLTATGLSFGLLVNAVFFGPRLLGQGPQQV